MFDNFLTSILKIVIVVDILGAIAYFALGGLKAKRRQALQVSLGDQTADIALLKKPFRERLAGKSLFALARQRTVDFHVGPCVLGCHSLSSENHRSGQDRQFLNVVHFSFLVVSKKS